MPVIGAVMPMKFISKDKRFELTLASGPDLEGWCKASVLIECEHGIWSSPQDPCLMFNELEALEGYFENNGYTYDEREIDFIEPELSFKMVQQYLEVKLQYALCPPWAVKDKGYVVIIDTDAKTMSKAAAYIREYRHNKKLQRKSLRSAPVFR